MHVRYYVPCWNYQLLAEWQKKPHACTHTHTHTQVHTRAPTSSLPVIWPCFQNYWQIPPMLSFQHSCYSFFFFLEWFSEVLLWSFSRQPPSPEASELVKTSFLSAPQTQPAPKIGQFCSTLFICLSPPLDSERLEGRIFSVIIHISRKPVSEFGRKRIGREERNEVKWNELK